MLLRCVAELQREELSVEKLTIAHLAVVYRKHFIEETKDYILGFLTKECLISGPFPDLNRQLMLLGSLQSELVDFSLDLLHWNQIRWIPRFSIRVIIT